MKAESLSYAEQVRLRTGTYVSSAQDARDRMVTVVWFRNFLKYLDILSRQRYANLVVTDAMMNKRPDMFIAEISSKIPSTLDWRAMFVSGRQALAPVFAPGLLTPIASYPIWRPEMERRMLRTLIENPVGQQWYDNDEIAPWIRPSATQEHVIVIDLYKLPNNHIGRRSREIVTWLEEVMRNNPDVKFHLHGLSSYSQLFGRGFASVDIAPQNYAKMQRGLILPTGGRVTNAELRDRKFKYWINLLGYTPSDMKDTNNRIAYNVASALWAGRYFSRLDKWRKPSGTIDSLDPNLENYIKESSRVFIHNVKPQQGDKIICDTCSLWASCRYFREGAVCAVEDSEIVNIGKLFGTRNSDSIIKGMGGLLELQTDRIAQGKRQEASTGVLSNDLTNLIDKTVKQAAELAKLIDPALRPGNKLAITANQVSVSETTPAVTAQIFAAIEAMGIPREKIKPEMVKAYIEASTRKDVKEITRGDIISDDIEGEVVK